MTTSVYPIHQAIARPVTFKGIQAQYILLAAAAIIGDLLLFIVLYCCRISPWICTLVVIALGAIALYSIGWASRKYGVHGLMKIRARRRIPRCIPCRSRRPFIQLNKSTCLTD